MAVWKDPAGKTICRSTKVPIAASKGMTARQAEMRARQIAEAMESVAKGSTPVSRALDAVRAAAEMTGAGMQMPTVREYLASYPATTSESSERNRQRAFNVFLGFLGDKAERRLDSITYAICRDFIRYQLTQVKRSTVTQYHTYIQAAFARAVNIDDLMTKNPMLPVKVAEEAAQMPTQEQNRREPFTPGELELMMRQFPEPWGDMVATSYYLFGLRLSDVCLLTWEDIDWDKKVITLTEMKTKRKRTLPIASSLMARFQKIREGQPVHEEYIFPVMAHYYLAGSHGYVSTQFTSLLRAHGIIPSLEQKDAVAGRRKRVSTKSFHSIRHSVVSYLRPDVRFTADTIRDAVGHESEEVERGYFTGTLNQRRAVSAALEDMMNKPSESQLGKSYEQIA